MEASFYFILFFYIIQLLSAPQSAAMGKFVKCGKMHYQYCHNGGVKSKRSLDAAFNPI